MPAYKYWRKIGLEHEIADISLQLEGQGESLKQNKKVKGTVSKIHSWKYLFFNDSKILKKYQTHDLECNIIRSIHSVFQPKLITEFIIIRMINAWCVRVTW